MKLKRLVWLACLWASAATAQTAATDAADCPAIPEDTAQTLRWDAMRIPNMLFCRAVLIETGTEAFAVTISRESPFRPKRGLRAETGTLDGRPVQWYRGEVSNEPNVQIRETLIELEDDRVVHIFMRAPDADALVVRLKMAESIRLGGSP
ncbi:MAG: hypothetical protein IT473_11125 [Lysobacter sp.]|nr:hypothetical protein [Lysobacter sp.]